MGHALPKAAAGYDHGMRNALYRGALWLGYRALILKWRLKRPTLHGAYVAVWHDGRLLLIRNSYKRGLTLPCGGLKRRESHRAAARRELAEEVGIEVPEEQLRFSCEIRARGRHADDWSKFFELECKEEPEIRIDQTEVVWAAFCPEEELSERPLIAPVRLYLARRAEHPSGESKNENPG